MNMIYYRILLLYRNIPVSVRKSSIFTIKSTTDQVLLPRQTQGHCRNVISNIEYYEMFKNLLLKMLYVDLLQTFKCTHIFKPFKKGYLHHLRVLKGFQRIPSASQVLHKKMHTMKSGHEFFADFFFRLGAGKRHQSIKVS